MGWLFGTPTMVSADKALPGRAAPAFAVPERHRVLGTSLTGPWPGAAVLYLALGCFWGAEKELWQVPGVIVTAVGYQGGHTPHPTYEEVCTGRTGHAETVMVVYDPTQATATDLLRRFWALHDPTQGFRQGNDVGTQYRSAVFTTTDAQLSAAETTRADFARELAAHGFGAVTTEIRPVAQAGPFFYAEDYHQQYLDANPAGYCPVHATGLVCPAPS